MADQDHGLDDVRELARGLRENENPGREEWENLKQNRDEARTQLATAREEVEAARRRCDKLGAANDEEFTGRKEAEARASRAEAALERVRKWAVENKKRRNAHVPLRAAAEDVLSLIEHGPDDGEPE